MAGWLGEHNAGRRRYPPSFPAAMVSSQVKWSRARGLRTFARRNSLSRRGSIMGAGTPVAALNSAAYALFTYTNQDLHTAEHSAMSLMPRYENHVNCGASGARLQWLGRPCNGRIVPHGAAATAGTAVPLPALTLTHLDFCRHPKLHGLHHGSVRPLPPDVGWHVAVCHPASRCAVVCELLPLAQRATPCARQQRLSGQPLRLEVPSVVFLCAGVCPCHPCTQLVQGVGGGIAC